MDAAISGYSVAEGVVPDVFEEYEDYEKNLLDLDEDIEGQYVRILQ